MKQLKLREQRLAERIQVDYGTEFTSRAMLYWAQERGIQLNFIKPPAARNSLNGWIDLVGASQVAQITY